MGLVYLKQGKPKHAEHHFRRAAEINPSNAVLLCCIGAVGQVSQLFCTSTDLSLSRCWSSRMTLCKL
jgi:hypothetical protein